MVTNDLRVLQSMQYPNGLFAASKKNVSTGYNMAWIRDNVYAVLGLEATKHMQEVKRTLRALFDIFKKHEYKIDWMIRQPHPKARHRYIHARYDPFTGNEIWDDWGDKQNDAVGGFLFKVGELENRGVHVMRDEHDTRIIRKLVQYLEAIEYWHDPDNGVWENDEEIHASSIGACVAGLREVQTFVDVQPELIQRGRDALRAMLPRESHSRKVDLAQLSLIYPYNVVDEQMREEILKNVEFHLVRDNGVVRYHNDWYYKKDGREAEWCFGFVWLAIIYKQLQMPHKYAFYMRKTVEIMNDKGEIPELYEGGVTPNENTPLAWAQSLWVVAQTL